MDSLSPGALACEWRPAQDDPFTPRSRVLAVWCGGSARSQLVISGRLGTEKRLLSAPVRHVGLFSGRLLLLVGMMMMEIEEGCTS